jgi:3-phytase
MYFQREGAPENPHQHQMTCHSQCQLFQAMGRKLQFQIFRISKGLFVAMSDDKTFQIYDWRDLENYIKKSK